MLTFSLEISYSQIAVFDASLAHPFNTWTQEHFDQGFVWRPGSVSFRTSVRTGQATVTVEHVDAASVREDAVLAIAVPFHLAGRSLEVASIFNGEVMEFGSGDYELVFQTGKAGTLPWVALQFITGSVESARLIKGREHLRATEPLLMTGGPA